MGANESRMGLARDLVRVARLTVGDVAIGQDVLVERKTTEDLVASLGDGRLFRQARQLASSASRPVVIQEGDPSTLEKHMDPGAYRGALLSLAVGFRIPVIMTSRGAGCRDDIAACVSASSCSLGLGS